MTHKPHIPLSVFFFCVYQLLCAQQIEVVHLFGGHDFIAANQQLVVVVDYPQTEIAKSIGQKIYTDTNQLRIIQNTTYEIDHSKEKIELFCGQDVYVYVKEGQNLNLFYAFNSGCFENNGDCALINLLDSMGVPLERQLSKRAKHIADLTKRTDSFVFGPFQKTDVAKADLLNYRFNEIGENLRGGFYDGYYLDSIPVFDSITRKYSYSVYRNNLNKYLENLPLSPTEKAQIGVISELNYNDQHWRPGDQKQYVELRIYLSKDIFLKLDKPQLQWVKQKSKENYYWCYRPKTKKTVN